MRETECPLREPEPTRPKNELQRRGLAVRTKLRAGRDVASVSRLVDLDPTTLPAPWA